ncbi:MAG: hypothetical protein ACK4YP_12405 [Myxococcota bacterium]
MEPVVHRGLVWITADPRELDLLLADPHLGKLVAARPAPGLAGVRAADEGRFSARLARIGQVPRRVEGA